jgi:mannosyltransferase OCH1-like enzyme
MNSNMEICKISEDNILRSEYIRKIVQRNISSINFCSPNEMKIPKTIVQFWHNLNDITDDVNTCLNSWEPLRNLGFVRVVFDNTSARSFILEKLGEDYLRAYDRCHHPAMRCDYFRLCYILIHGGFYIDADEFYQGVDCSRLFEDNKLKIQPLCYDIDTEKMIKIDRFIVNHEYCSTWIFYVNNNPLIAPPNHPVIRLALNRSTKILLRCKNGPLDIQSITGPGNLSASLVLHSLNSEMTRNPIDFYILPDWESISISSWPLSYRKDIRNWRLWNNSDIWNY